MDFKYSMSIILRLIFYNLNGNIIVGLHVPTFSNLSKCTLAKYVFNNVPKISKTTKVICNLF